MLSADVADCIARGEVLDNGDLTNATQTRLSYKYAPFFLKEHEGMPPIKRIELDGIPVESADAEWIADNIDLQEIVEIFSKGCEVNNATSLEKKS